MRVRNRPDPGPARQGGVRRRSVLLLTAIVLGLLVGTATPATEAVPEYKIKAAFLYKFLLFIEWPDSAFTNEEQEVVIGVIGADPFGTSFEGIEGRMVNGRKVSLRRFRRKALYSELRECHLLFICTSEEENLGLILAELDHAPVLTVGESNGFLDQGGMINFVLQDRKIRFEINDQAARRAGLQIRSMLLRLAINDPGGAGGHDEP